MRSILNTYSGILQLRTETFVTIKHSKDGFWFAIRLFVVVSLIAALGQWFGWGIVLRQPTLPEQIHQVVAVIEVIEENLPDWLPQTGAEWLSALAQESVDFVTGVEERTASLLPPLGARPSRAVNLFGVWLAIPFHLMANFLVFALVVLVVAKLMGGKGTLSQHLSLTMLVIAPYALAFVAYIPANSIVVDFALGIFGRTLTLLVGVWAVAILLKALTVAHEIELKRALMTVVSAFAVLYLLIPVTITLATAYILFG